jgi:hypothetical protein
MINPDPRPGLLRRTARESLKALNGGARDDFSDQPAQTAGNLHLIAHGIVPKHCK